MRRTISCCRLLQLVQPDELIDDRLHLGDCRLIDRRAGLGHRPIDVAATDDVADAVFVAVDGELVLDGQRPALVADLCELLFIGEGHARRHTAARAAEPLPGRAVNVENRLGRIDEIVPQLIERLGHPPLEVFQPPVAVRFGGLGVGLTVFGSFNRIGR